ncbi:hypothetical protein GCG54_00003893, partial [Colletotrichum gloeosporioides]
IKCRSSEAALSQCQNCVGFGIECQLSRPSKRGKAGGSERIGRTIPSMQRTSSSIAATVVPSDRGLRSDGPPEPVSHDSVVEPSSDRTELGDGNLPTGTLAPAWCAFAWKTLFTSIVWDGCIHFQEAHSMVEYPEGDQSGFLPAGNPNWIEGWNFTTDLYRILEHVLCKLRTRHSRFNLFGDCHSRLETHRLQDRVNGLHFGLHHRFKEFGLATGVAEKDIYGFQAANIQATLALLRMALLSLEGDVDLDKKCSVVNEVLTAFHQVPKAFQRAISNPLIYHIGSIGIILGSVMEGMSPFLKGSSQTH